MDSQINGYRIVLDPHETAAERSTLLPASKCEHLTDVGLKEFVDFAAIVIARDGAILVYVPIEIGPVVLMKELSRAVLFRRRPGVAAKELLNSALRAVLPRRAKDGKTLHRGSAWREMQRIQEQTSYCEHVEFSPLPYNNWYGQSQVLMRFKSSRSPKSYR
jgi:hypothetical protein